MIWALLLPLLLLAFGAGLVVGWRRRHFAE